MKKHIAILRGINVGGKRKILMADLKSLFESLGFAHVKTYIQSGNVVFDVKEAVEDLTLAEKLEKAIAEQFNLDVPVVVRSAEEWESLLTVNPFLKNDSSDLERLHVTFLKYKTEVSAAEVSEMIDSGDDRFELVGKDIFVYCSGKYSDTKLQNLFFEKKFKVPATTRNWKTVLKLKEML